MNCSDRFISTFGEFEIFAKQNKSVNRTSLDYINFFKAFYDSAIKIVSAECGMPVMNSFINQRVPKNCSDSFYSTIKSVITIFEL